MPFLSIVSSREAPKSDSLGSTLSKSSGLMFCFVSRKYSMNSGIMKCSSRATFRSLPDGAASGASLVCAEASRIPPGLTAEPMTDIWDTKFRREELLEFCSFNIDAPFMVMFTAVVPEFFMGVVRYVVERDCASHALNPYLQAP